MHLICPFLIYCPMKATKLLNKLFFSCISSHIKGQIQRRQSKYPPSSNPPSNALWSQLLLYWQDFPPTFLWPSSPGSCYPYHHHLHHWTTANASHRPLLVISRSTRWHLLSSFITNENPATSLWESTSKPFCVETISRTQNSLINFKYIRGKLILKMYLPALWTFLSQWAQNWLLCNMHKVWAGAGTQLVERSPHIHKAGGVACPNLKSQAWKCMPVILTLRPSEQEDPRFKVIFNYTAISRPVKAIGDPDSRFFKRKKQKLSHRSNDRDL